MVDTIIVEFVQNKIMRHVHEAKCCNISPCESESCLPRDIGYKKPSPSKYSLQEHARRHLSSICKHYLTVCMCDDYRYHVC